MNAFIPVAEPAATVRATACVQSLRAGIDILAHETGLHEGICGCGHPVAARSQAEALNALRDHFDYQTAQ